jgi:hypothetical protein
VIETKTHINIWIQAYKPTETGTEISKHPPRHISRGSERDEKHINVKILTYKATIAGIEIGKHLPRHIGKESEREKNTYKYMDSGIPTDRDRH